MNPRLVQAAIAAAKANGVDGKVNFFVDDACNSKIPTGKYSKVVCIGVTPLLPNEAAFIALIDHLDRISRQADHDARRSIYFGALRWAPSRRQAAAEIIGEPSKDLVTAFKELHGLENTFWLRPSHIELLKTKFTNVALVHEWNQKRGGTRVDLHLS